MAVSNISSSVPSFVGLPGKTASGSGDPSVVDQLRQRDSLVRRYVSSRQSGVAGSGLGPDFEFTRGPDGRTYAVKASVPLRVDEVPGDPQATIRNARSANRIASTPPMLSSEDSGVIFEARELEARARAEIERLDSERKALYSSDGKPHQPKPLALFSLLG